MVTFWNINLDSPLQWQWSECNSYALGSASYNSADAQNLVFTSGYSQMEHSFILDLEAGSLSEAGQQEVEPNLTFMDISGKNFLVFSPFSLCRNKNRYLFSYMYFLQKNTYTFYKKLWIIRISFCSS